MERLDSLLGSIPLSGAGHAPAEHGELGENRRRDGRLLPSGLAQDLGADLPQGHVHVWGGPAGAGKTAMLLGLLHDAATRGRACVYASYDLGAPALALRLLSMAADVPLDRLPDPHAPAPDGALNPAEVIRAASARLTLGRLPIHFLESRGFGVASLADRLVRLPHRPQVLVVDYLQAVVRSPELDPGVTLRELADLADHLHLAVVCVFREGLDLGVSLEEARAHVLRGDADASDSASDRGSSAALREQLRAAAAGVDRIGWLEPAADEETGTPARIAEILSNRHGNTRAVPFEMDPGSGRVGPA